MTQEALKLVTDALDDLLYWDNGKPEYDEARKALQVGKQALAQPEQEPVACEHKRTSIWTEDQTGHCNDCGASGRMRFIADTTPPQRTWVGLTKEQLATTDWSADFRAGALWAEAKLKENT